MILYGRYRRPGSWSWAGRRGLPEGSWPFTIVELIRFRQVGCEGSGQMLRVRSAVMDPDAVSTPHRFAGNERLRANPRPGVMKSWGCPWFPFVVELLRESAAKFLRSARVSRPRRLTDRRSPDDAPTVGDGGRRGRAGQETVPEPAWRRQPQVASMGQSDPLPRTGVMKRKKPVPEGPAQTMASPQAVAAFRVQASSLCETDFSTPQPRTPHGQQSVRRQRFGVSPPGLGTVGDDCSFLARGPRHQPTICLPIRVLAERREITLHASRSTPHA